MNNLTKLLQDVVDAETYGWFGSAKHKKAWEIYCKAVGINSDLFDIKNANAMLKQIKEESNS